MSSQNDVQKAFHDYSVQFLKSSIETWPDDKFLPIALLKVEAMSPIEAITLFDTQFSELVPKLTLKDVNALYQVGQDENLLLLDIQGKYDGSNAATQETIWNYITHLCRFSAMFKLYKHIPNNVLGAVTEAAEALRDKIDAGTFDTKNINPFEIGKQVMSQFDPKELNSMMTNLMANPDVMNTMMSQMTSLMGTAKASDNSTIDLSTLSSLMNGGKLM
jgi:hypothetical protein